MPYYYGNGYYNPYTQDQMQQLRNQQMVSAQMPIQSQDDKIFVQGELAAQAYLVAPGSFVRLWDSTQNVFYDKRADASGRPYMEVYDFKKRDNLTTQVNTEHIPTVNYDEKINALSKEIETLKGKIEEIDRKKGADKRGTKSNADDSAVSTI